MTASVKLSGEPCFFGCAADHTYEVKLKKPILHTVVCGEHLYEVLQRERSGEHDQPTSDAKNHASAKTNKPLLAGILEERQTAGNLRE
jgi:hypothetical protein